MIACLMRLKHLMPLVTVMVAVAVPIIAINFSAAFISRQFPGWLPPAEAVNGWVLDCHQRIALADYQVRNGKLDPQQPLCVIVGASTGRQGLDLLKLAEGDNLSYRYLGLCAAGHKIKTMASIAEPLWQSQLKPDLAILVVSPHQLSHVRYRNSVEPWAWITSRRIDLADALNRKIATVRKLVLRTSGSDWDQQICALKPSDLPRGISTDYLKNQADPFREMMRTSWNEHITQKQLDHILREYRNRKYDDIKRYPAYSSQLSQFLDLIDNFHKIGSRVIVVLPPERSLLREMVTAQAFSILKQSIQTTYGDSVSLLDCREDIHDEGFSDLGHLNTSGRDEFSQMLALRIAHNIPKELPLMTEQELIARRNPKRAVEHTARPVKSGY